MAPTIETMKPQNRLPAQPGSVHALHAVRVSVAFVAWILAFLSFWWTSGAEAADDAPRPPNFVVVFLDDSGWADFHPFGDPSYKTPNVHRLAREGCRFNNFYVPQAICSASRAALLSGCYPGRTKQEPRNQKLNSILRLPKLLQSMQQSRRQIPRKLRQK